MLTTPDLPIGDEERALLKLVVADVLAERAFLSLGEMTTITSWAVARTRRLAAELDSRKSALSPEEQRFLSHALYAWGVAFNNGRVTSTAATASSVSKLESRLDANWPSNQFTEE